MEASLIEAPQPAHALDGWSDAKLVAWLAAAGITTFADLFALIRARRLTDFIALHPDTLGYLSRRMKQQAASAPLVNILRQRESAETGGHDSGRLIPAKSRIRAPVRRTNALSRSA
ncbi:phage integrase family protein [Burkholderia stagnalis]|uniref:phage integrase family protein n=1 Tax=Burkholderia stagnalis TaxID=1503054 RepID=UPI001E60DBFE|nr:phage integrase family protein [Burkholderia stagnalis]